ncbi:MAG: OmpH family outer membrane protein [Myxococcales bacterium]|nr:OmpH family outer membrane protein [Myxococcales bacterium]
MVSPLLGGGFATGAVPVAKVGVIDIERTLYETPAGKRANEQFEKTRKDKQAELDRRQQELKKLDADLGKQASVLKPEVLKERRADLEKKFVDLQQVYVKLERDLAGERTKLVQELLKKANPIVQEIAKAEGVTLIIDQNAVVWADAAVDLTAKLNARMK